MGRTCFYSMWHWGNLRAGGWDHLNPCSLTCLVSGLRGQKELFKWEELFFSSYGLSIWCLQHGGFTSTRWPWAPKSFAWAGGWVWGGAYQRDAIVPLMTQLLKSCSGTSATVFWLSLLQCPIGFKERGTEALLLDGEVSVSHSV